MCTFVPILLAIPTNMIILLFWKRFASCHSIVSIVPQSVPILVVVDFHYLVSSIHSIIMDASVHGTP